VKVYRDDHSLREAKDPRFATSDADEPGGLNAVFTLGPQALLLLWRGYQDPARRTTSGPRSWSPTGRLAEILSALLLASRGRAVRRGAARAGRGERLEATPATGLLLGRLVTAGDIGEHAHEEEASERVGESRRRLTRILVEARDRA
jgi:hypothetical protein